MLELAVRLFAAGVLFLVSAWYGTPDPGVAWKISAVIGCYALAGFFIDYKGKSNAGTTGVLAVADSGSFVFVAAATHSLDQIGFAAIFPILYAHRKCQANIWYMAPVTAALVFGAHAAFTNTDPTSLLDFQVVGILILAALVKNKPQTEAIPTAIVAHENNEAAIDSDAFLALRENFRKLKDHCRDLERKTKREHLVSQLFETRLPSGEKFHLKLARRLQELLGVKSLALYTFSQFENVMIVRATSGETSALVEDNSFSIDPTQAARQITDNIELTMRAMLDDGQRSKVASVLLQSDSRAVGMLNIFHDDWDHLYEARRLCEEIGPIVSHMVVEENKKSLAENRLSEMELLYEMSAVSSGATSRDEILQRVIQRLKFFIKADFLGGYFIENNKAQLVYSSGAESYILDALSFGSGSNLAGWLSSGAPEVAVFRTSEDSRCDTKELLKRRVGSFILLALQYGENPFGFLMVVSRSSNGLDKQDLQTLRAVVAECSQAVARIEQPQSGARGLVSIAAFQLLASGENGGSLVFLELLKRQSLADNCSREAIDTALRSFSLRINAKLPPGGAACQRHQGDFVAYLPSVSEEFARSWANDLAATASMIGVPTAGGKRNMPLAFRARAARVGQQSSEVLSSRVA